MGKERRWEGNMHFITVAILSMVLKIRMVKEPFLVLVLDIFIFIFKVFTGPNWFSVFG